MNYKFFKELSRRGFIKRGIELTLLAFSQGAHSNANYYGQDKLVVFANNLSNKVLSDKKLNHVFNSNMVERFIMHLEEMSSGDATRYVNREITKDFERGQVYLVNGHVFSSTEILICLSCNRVLRS